jgi:hypothetical protein
MSGAGITFDVGPDGRITVVTGSGISTYGYLNQVVQRMLGKAISDATRRARYAATQVTTYDIYVDSVNGLDANAGTSPDAPWKTLAKVVTSATASQKIGLARGSVFREQMVNAWDGLTFGAYGPMTAALPKIKGSKDYSAATWTRASGTSATWQATITAPGIPAGAAFWKEDTVLYPSGSASLLNPGTYNITGTTFTIWLPDSSNPNGQQIEVTDLGSASYLVRDRKVGTTWQDIKICHSQGWALLRQAAIGSSNGNFRRLEIGPCAGQGINIQDGTGGVIEDSYFHDCWSGVQYPSGAGDAIHLGGTSNPTFDVEVRYNRMLRCYTGLTAQGAYKGLNVHHNQIVLSQVNGLDIQAGVAGYTPAIFNNFIFHRPTSDAGHGIVSQLANVGSIWRNNIVVSDFTGTNSNVQLYSLNQAISGLPGMDIDYNLGWLYPGSTADYGRINTTGYKTLALWQAAFASSGLLGLEAHGQQADPLLADPANGDYTLLPNSPALNAGIALGYPGEFYIGAAPDLGQYEIA